MLLCSIATILCACADTGTASVTTVTDSAGVRIVDSSTGLWQENGQWTVEAEPAVEIGVVEGDLPYEFQRIAGAVRLTNGTFAVADGGTNEVRLFSADGTHLRSVGRTGEGPGEYEYIRALLSCGNDSIFAFDLNWQLKVYNLDGELARETTLLQPGVSRTPYNLNCSATGQFVVVGWGEQAFQRPIGFYQATSPVYVLDQNGDPILELGEFISSERIGTPRGSGPHPFGRAASFAISGDEVFVGTGEKMEVQAYGLDGTLRRIFRGPVEDLTIRAEHLDAYREQSLRNVPDERRPERERQLRDMPMPERFPAFTDLRMDPDGRIWVHLFQRPGTEEQRWGVFAADGTYLGGVEMPPDLTITEIGSDYVLGVHLGEMDVQRVRLHRIRQPSLER